MYNNTDNLEVGKDYHNAKTGKYVFTYIFDGYERVELEGFDVPLTVKSSWSDKDHESWGYNKISGVTLDQYDVSDLCSDNVLISKERLDEINQVKEVLMNILEESGIQEPFIYEDGKFSVGKEQVLSAHINTGQEHGWISSSICW